MNMSTIERMLNDIVPMLLIYNSLGITDETTDQLLRTYFNLYVNGMMCRKPGYNVVVKNFTV